MPRTAAALAPFLAILCLAAAATAQEAQEEPVRQPLVGDLDLRPTVGVSAGYDTNPRESPDGRGSAFTRLDLGLRASLGEESGTQAVLNLQGNVVKFLRSEEDIQHELLAELEVGHAVSDELRLSFGAMHQRDDRDDPATTLSEAWAQAEADLGRVDLTLRGAVAEYRERVDRAEIVELDLEVYDYRTAAAEVRAMLDTGTRVAPLVRGRVAAIDYLERRPGKPERDALEHSVLAGAAITLSDALFIEGGLRHTQRIFDDPGAGSYSRIGPDVEITWEPSEELRLTAAYGHYFGEPNHEDVLVLDATFAQLDVAYQASERLRLAGGAVFTDEKEVGTPFHTRRWEAYADARWLLRERLHLIAAARLEQERPQDPESDAYRRVIVRAGLESTF
jgi:hypothetical protein